MRMKRTARAGSPRRTQRSRICSRQPRASTSGQQRGRSSCAVPAAPMVSGMTGERSRYGLLVSSLGAALLAGSLFLPWYAVSVTQSGAGSLGKVGTSLAAHVGSGALTGGAGGLHGTLAALAGEKVGALTAEQALSALSVVLLVLAGLSLLDALVPLARARSRIPE